MILQNIDAIPQLGTCGPSKNCLVFVPFGAACGAYSIRPYDRIRVILRKTVPFLSPTGPRGGAYAIRPYNWVRAILRNTDAISQPGTYSSSKNCPVFVPYRAAKWDVFNTPLQLGTCDPSKYRCDLSIGGAGVFGRWGGGGYRLRGRWA